MDMIKIFKLIFKDILKNKTTLVFLVVLAVMSWVSFSMEDDVNKGLITIMNEILFIVPLMSILFSTIYLHNCRECIVLLLGHPIRRATIWNGIYAGVASSLCLAYLLGAGIPILVYSFNMAGLLMIFMGLCITLVFVSLAFLICSFVSDKSKGIGLALILWLFLALIYDGIILFILFQFSDYPIDHFMIGTLMLNPIDLARLQMLIKLDVSAIMGYAGAAFKELVGKKAGIIVSFLVLVLWVVLPYLWSVRLFRKKDL
ncbi:MULTISPECIES: ABC transporter permease subunit [Bacteroides]|uniref:ABC transporter permease subunit n=1 Tax=Bacteroides TaxID=816 RepID=UPI001B7D8429|nr:MULTISPECIES: ABC transporter permease subunit [Bacteroides]